MADKEHGPGIIVPPADYDAVIVGASLAGCAAAIFLGRTGARVALVDKQPDVRAYKRICSHLIQDSAVPTLRRLGLLDPIMAAGGIRSRLRLWSRWGWIAPPQEPGEGAVNLRRELLDPLMREAAAATPGVELVLGRAARGLVRDGGVVRGVELHDRDGAETVLRARLVVGADGRESHVAQLAGIRNRTTPHGRFAYGGYFEGGAPHDAPDASVWLLDPQWAAAFPTDGGLTFYAAMPTKDRLPEFKRDPAAALVRFLADVPEAPPIREGRLAGPVMGKLEMPSHRRDPIAPGLALIGDAALAADPLWGVGCGWALQSAEWLADAVAPALAGAEPLADGLTRYRRRHARGLGGHARVIDDYANGRRFNAGERMLFSAAARDARIAAIVEEFGARRCSPGRMLVRGVPRALAFHARRLGERPRAGARVGAAVRA